MKQPAQWKLLGLLALALAMAAWLLLYDPLQSLGAGPAAEQPEHFRAITHPATALLPMLPLPPPSAQAAAKAALGQRLFHDTRLSRDNSVSCSSCHDLAHGGVDHRPSALGIGGQLGPINTPTVFNTDLNLAQFWDGRARTLEEQAAGPVHNPLEMGSNWQEAIAKLNQDPDFVSAFHKSYPQGISPEALVDAIASFERTLRTPNSRYDRFLNGDATAFSALETMGYQHFLKLGCASCHQGVAVGGNMFQRFGIMEDYFQGRPYQSRDLGRFNVTQQPADLHVFKVPSLRNVALTAPYFHDASATTLEEAVRIMGRYQLGRILSDEEVKALVAFLGTLTGEWQGHTLQ